jgi:hypothetical protein
MTLAPPTAAASGMTMRTASSRTQGGQEGDAGQRRSEVEGTATMGLPAMPSQGGHVVFFLFGCIKVGHVYNVLVVVDI